MPWKFRERTVQQQWHQRSVARLAIVFVALLAIAAIPYGWMRFQHWIEVRRLVRASDAFQRGDFREALLNARAVLKKNSASEVARQIIDSAAEALHSPEATSWQRARAAMESGDTDQLLGLAEAFVSAGDFLSAERALSRLKPDARNTARYHRLAARVATKKGDVAAAETHWAEAIQLAPDDDENRLDLAALQLASPQPQKQALGLSAIDKLKVKDDSRLPALRLLLEDARRHEDKARAREVAAIIAADREAEFSDKLALLTTLRALGANRDQEFSTQFAQLQQFAATEPENVFSLMSWMIDHDLALLVPDWAAKFPPEVVSVPPVAPAIAQACVKAADWKRLKAKVEAESWSDLETLRLAFLSLAFDRTGDTKAADATWEQALDAAADSPSQLERLGKAGLVWQVTARGEQALWRLGASDWCPRWVMDYLWATGIERHDTAKLYEASKLLLKAQPEDIGTRNNHITLALLTGQDLAEAHLLATALHAEAPTHLPAASTCGLSLLLQGRAKDAVVIMDAFKPDELRDPLTALYFGSFLTAAGQTERAPTFLQLAERARPLPEEKRLLEVSVALHRTRSLEQSGDARDADAAWRDALTAAAAQPDLLELLARTALDWSWQDRAESALLKLADRERCPAWGRTAVWSGALKTGDSARILRVSRLLAKTKPEDRSARTAFTLLGLLAGGDKETPRVAAATLYKEAPGDPEVVITHGLSLTQQGRPEEAVALIAKLASEEQHDPRVALYHGIFLAAAGRTADARPQLELGATGIRFPEEKALAAILRLAFDTNAASWDRALAAAEGHPDWLEMLARIAQNSGSSPQAEATLWKLATEERCPRWALDSLWASVQKSGTSAQRYKLSKLLVKADPKSIPARNQSVLLALLTNQEVDVPHKQAESLYKQYVSEPGVAGTYGLSLYLQNRSDEALKLFESLSPAQLHDPHTAFYYGILLASTGQPQKAADHLRLGLTAPLFPEERALVEKVATDDSLKPLLTESAQAGK